MPILTEINIQIIINVYLRNHANREVGILETRVFYSELFELFLLLRQIYSNERFRPFNPLMSSMYEKLSSESKRSIDSLGILTNGYLSALRVLIDSQELSLSDLVENPSLLFLSDRDVINDESVIEQYNRLRNKYFESETLKVSIGLLLKDLWSDYVCREKANYSRKLLDRIESLKMFIKDSNSLGYLESLSDRFFIDGSFINFRIKPELQIKISEIEQIFIVPSLYASRELTFWYSDKKLLFFVSLEWNSHKSYDPSDMQLLYTSAFNDKTRLKMLKYINGKNCSAGELAQFLKMNPSTVSRHLKLFKDAGFVDLYSNDGKHIIYTINRVGIQQALTELETFIFDEES